MDGLHIPAWDGTSGLFEEYPSAAAFPAAKAAKGAGKSEKILRREQERLQTMINGVVILSAPTGDTAEGVSDDTASLAQRKTKKRKTGSKGESGDTAARGQTRDDKVHSSVQAVLGSNGQTRDLVPIQKQTQLGKRKAPDLAAIGKDIEPHQLPESKASQQEGAHKKCGADNIKKQEEKAALYLGSAAASDAAQAAREGDVRRDANHSASKQALQNSLARDISQPAEGVKKKRSRNKFKQEDLVAQHVLPKSSESMATVQDSTAQSQPAEAVREKRDRTQFKQYDVSAQEVVPNSSQGKVRVQEFTAGSQPVEPVKKKRNRNKFKQDEAPAQQMLPDSSALKAMLPEPVEESQPSEAVIKNRNRNKVRQNEMPTQQVLRMSSEGNAKKQDPAGQYQPAAEVRKRRNRNKFKQDDASDQHVVPTSLAVKDTVQQDESAKVRNKAKQEVFAQPQAKSAALQSDETQERQARKQMKGVNAIAKADAAGSAQQSRVTGKVRKEEAIPSSQRAAGASRQKDDGLLSKMRAKLAGSQFRWLNEQLYTCPGDQAFELMQEQPHLFTQYHEGFKQQTAKWPLQPIQAAAAYLAKQSRNVTVADFGCGDAELARMAPQEKVHSLDLVSSAPGVIACNMADTPLDTASVDVAVFCLALMGTDYSSFLEEAARVLKPHGIIWIAEVRSRFVPDGGQQEDYGPFLQAMRGLGFARKSMDCSNSHFVTFELQRQGLSDKGASLAWPRLRACSYKKR